MSPAGVGPTAAPAEVTATIDIAATVVASGDLFTIAMSPVMK
jgi:hypothetical protein